MLRIARSPRAGSANGDLKPSLRPERSPTPSSVDATRSHAGHLLRWNPLRRRLLPLSAFQRLAGAAVVAALLWFGFFWATADFAAR